MGSWYRTGKRGIWAIRYYDVNGVQRDESARSTDLQVAKNLLKDREAAIAKGVPVTPQMGRFTFEQAQANIIADYQQNKRASLDHLRRRLKPLARWFGHRRMASITPTDVRAYIAARQTDDGAENSTINRELAALRRMFRLAILDGILATRPHVPLLAENAPRTGFFDLEPFEAARRHLPEWLRPLATAMYYTGWRVQRELQPLEWSHVDRAHHVIRLPPAMSKNKDGRVFPYGGIPDLAAAIETCWQHHLTLLKEETIAPWVFVRMSGKKRRGTQIKVWRKPWLAACRAAGVPGRLKHDCRRTASRNLRRAGIESVTRMKLIGHKTASMDKRYSIIDEDELSAATARLGASLQGEVQGEVGGSGEVGQKGQVPKLLRKG